MSDATRWQLARLLEDAFLRWGPNGWLAIGDNLLAAGYVHRDEAMMESAWLRREIQWCSTRLKKDAYKVTLEKHLAEGPKPLPENEPDVVLSALQRSASTPRTGETG